MSEKRGKSDECGLILLGNSGVGKSFLANRLLDTDIFQTKFSPQSVTRETESIPIEFNGKKYVVYNIPGLIEADQMLINQNIQEIKKAFEMSSNSIVIFIFGQLAGRIQDEQVVAFNLLNAACNFQPESLLIFLNNINDEMSKGYEDNVRYLLTNLTGTAKDHIYFLNQVQTFDDRRHLHQVLWKAVTTCVPTDYKMRNITLAVKEIPQLTKESKKQQEELLASKVRIMIY
jgi:tRNA U34 5-carboxymethylaminomethyl modifying GTPase MnmE/TrmE